MVDAFGTSRYTNEQLADAVQKVFDLRPAAIIRDLDLRRPIYRRLAAYGQMGREDLGVPGNVRIVQMRFLKRWPDFSFLNRNHLAVIL